MVGVASGLKSHLAWQNTCDNVCFLESEPCMALTPLRIFILVITTLVFTVLGVALIVIGIHGSQIATMLGGFFLLPSIVLMRLGVPMGIPLLQSMSILSLLLFLLLQTAYYYFLLQLIYFVTGRRQRATA
jgi:hypothetical protein